MSSVSDATMPDGYESADDGEAVEAASDGEAAEEAVEPNPDEEPKDPKAKDRNGKAQKRRSWHRAAKAKLLKRLGASRSRRWIAAVVLVAVLTGAGYEGWLLFEQHQREVAAVQALDAAQKFAVKFTNADPSTIDQAIRDITDATTGEFKARYVRSISQLRAMLIENKVTTRGTVVRSAIESVTADKVEVLLFVKESFTSAALPAPPAGHPVGHPAESPVEPPTDVVGMAITMEKVDGRWLASKVVPGDGF